MTSTGRSIRYGGIALVAAGVLALVYTALQANTHGTFLSLGEAAVTTAGRKDSAAPAIMGLVALLGGISLLRFDGRRLQPR